jgi:hypothetical protein
MVSALISLPRTPHAGLSSFARLRGGALASNAPGEAVGTFGTLVGYNSVIYYPWQVQLLVMTSICMGVAAATALAARQRTLGTVSGLVSVASVNYWRAPGPGWRRDADAALAATSLAYCLFVGRRLRGALSTAGMGAFLSFFLCFRRSFQSAVGDGGDGSWARWHALGHVCVSLATLCLAANRVEDEQHQPPSEPPPRTRRRRNPLWLGCIVTVAAVCAVDGIGGAIRARAAAAEAAVAAVAASKTTVVSRAAHAAAAAAAAIR